MKKFLIISTSLIALALLLGEVFYPNFPLVWMASEGVGYVLIRAAIVVTLTILFYSGGIKSAIFKQVLLVGASALLGLTTALLIADSLSFADGIIFVEAAIVLTLEVLEAPAYAARVLRGRPIGKFGVGNDFVKIS